MADFNIQPVATGIKPPQGMSLGEMVNMAGALQAYKQAQQLNPLQVEQAQAQLSRLQQLTPLELERAQSELSRLQQLTPEEVARAAAEARVAIATEKPRIATATSQATTAAEQAKTAETTTAVTQMDFLEKKFKKIADSQISMINNPMVIRAEKGDPSVDPFELVDLVRKNGQRIAKDLGISEDEANKLLAPYIEIAQAEPTQLRGYFKQRHIEGLDQASRTSALSPSGIPIDTGAGGRYVQTGEFANVPVGATIKGTEYTRELPPTTTYVTPEGETKTVGRMQGGEQVTTQLPPAQVSTLKAGGEIIAEDLPRTLAAAKDAPKTIQRAIDAAPRYQDLNQILEPKQIELVKNIARDLEREEQFADLAAWRGQMGPKAAKIGEEASFRIPQVITDFTAVLATRVFKAFQGKVGEQEAIKIAMANLDPKAMAVLLGEAMMAGRKMKTTVEKRAQVMKNAAAVMRSPQMLAAQRGYNAMVEEPLNAMAR